MIIRKLFTLDNPAALWPMFLVALGIGIARQLWWQYLGTIRGPLGLCGIPLVLCPLLVLFVAFATLIIFKVLRSLWLTGSMLPTVFLVLGIFVGFQIPLPDHPDTPEKLHFLKYRADYETVVELARNSALERAPGIEYWVAFRLPVSLKHVSAAGDMEVYTDKERGLVVFFYPLEHFYHLVAYVEFDNVEYPCGRDPHVEQKIEDHWYVCEYEWN